MDQELLDKIKEATPYMGMRWTFDVLKLIMHAEQDSMSQLVEAMYLRGYTNDTR